MDKIKILIKYGELTLKKKNLAVFKNKLLDNIISALNSFDVSVKGSYSRIYVECMSNNYEEVIHVLKRIYGIHSFAVYESCENNIDQIKNLAFELIQKKRPTTFKVETKRKNKAFKIQSTEVSRTVGGYINQNSEFEVDVHNPEITVKIEIRNDKCLIYTDSVIGAGGLPVGMGGKGLLMLSGGIDSPVAGYMINKRGVCFDAIHFTSPPYTQQQSIQKVFDLCKNLKIYNGDFTLYLVQFTKIQEEFLKMRKNSYFMPVMRRMMYRIADEISRIHNYRLIINGDSIGQVASQTVESMNVVDRVCNVTVMRPLGIFDKIDVVSIAKDIGTYDISIRQFEDCCTVFVPENPVIKPRQEIIDKIENDFDIEKMLVDALENMEIIKVSSIENEFKDYL